MTLQDIKNKYRHGKGFKNGVGLRGRESSGCDSGEIRSCAADEPTGCHNSVRFLGLDSRQLHRV